MRSLFPELEEKQTSKILEFSVANYNYYLENISEIVSTKEFNYLFAKIYRRFIEVKDSKTKEVEVLVELMIKFLEHYQLTSVHESYENYEVLDELNDRVFFTNDTSIKKLFYLKIIRDYKFQLSSEYIDKFLEVKKESFSKFKYL